MRKRIFEIIETAKEKVSNTAYLMGKAQTGMSSYGIPQPITDGTTNTFYYSKQAPELYMKCIRQVEGVGLDVQGIREALFKMEYIWKHGASPKASKMPTSYPCETSSNR